MSQFISVFDMLKIGVGPSSSHTLGPWRAAQEWVQKIRNNDVFDIIDAVKVDLYGSLSLTGRGHATDLAILLGLSEADPEYIPIEDIFIIVDIRELLAAGKKELNETRGKVISDYQNTLEAEWIASLQEKYIVSINKEVLYSLIK